MQIDRSGVLPMGGSAGVCRDTENVYLPSFLSTRPEETYRMQVQGCCKIPARPLELELPGTPMSQVATDCRIPSDGLSFSPGVCVHAREDVTSRHQSWKDEVDD